MTRAEFFRTRAIADHIKTHGITHVPAGVAETIDLVTPRRTTRGGRRKQYARIAATMTAHPTDETGEAAPINSASTAGRSPQPAPYVWPKR